MRKYIVILFHYFAWNLIRNFITDYELCIIQFHVLYYYLNARLIFSRAFFDDTGLNNIWWKKNCVIFVLAISILFIVRIRMMRLLFSSMRYYFWFSFSSDIPVLFRVNNLFVADYTTLIKYLNSIDSICVSIFL